MNAKSFHLSVQGASHIKKNKECQDASSSYQDDKCVIAVVCDGHGGDDYVRSAIGSTLGCGVAEKNLKNFIHGMDKDTFFSDPERHLKILEASIINGWNEAINLYHSTNPFTDKELSVVSEKARKKYVEDGRIESAYGTTMIAVAMTQEYWFGIHIGDGKCVAINPEGEFKQPIPWDPKCFLNATTSICDSDAIERFRHFYSDKLPVAVFVGSDGIDDCFSNKEQLYNLYKTVLYSFATSDFKEACEGLEDYLPRLSAKGSGDDVSVAALLDLDLIPELSVVKEYDREKEKARVEENARKEAEKNEAEKRRVEEEHARFQQQNNAKAKKEQAGRGPKFCENCGSGLNPGAKFCSNCGSKIGYVDVGREPKYCGNCGSKIDPRAKFCSNCGSKIRSTDEPVDPPYGPANPPHEPVNPSYEPANPSHEPINPPHEPINPPVEPANPTVETVNPPVELGGGKDIQVMSFMNPDPEKKTTVEDPKVVQKDIQAVDNKATIVVKEEGNDDKQEKPYISSFDEEVELTTEDQKKTELDSDDSVDKASSVHENISQGDEDVVISGELEIVLTGETDSDNNEDKEISEEHTDGQEIRNNEDTSEEQENVKQDTDI